MCASWDLAFDLRALQSLISSPFDPRKLTAKRDELVGILGTHVGDVAMGQLDQISALPDRVRTRQGAEVDLSPLKHIARVELTKRATGTPQQHAASHEHYLLTCIDCDFLHHIPSNYADDDVEFSVNPREGKMQCIYGREATPGRFTVTLDVKDFFSFTIVPESGRLLRVDIGPNMKVLHPHMLTHCDPLFLIIKQHPSRTEHTYKREQEDNTYVRFSALHGIDIVGDINISKAEIPGVSE